MWDGTKWTNVSGLVAPSGRNFLHNSYFNVQQRGAGPWAIASGTGVYTVDRWAGYCINDTLNIAIVGLTDADRSQIGDEAAAASMQLTFTGSATASSFSEYYQSIEGLQRLSGKTISVSFWAKATSGNPRIGISVNQNFGSGGSPSAAVLTKGFLTPALTTTWQRVSGTMTLPSMAGKTLGTAANHCTQLLLVTSDQSGTYTPSLGVQSGVVQLWGMQLELGSTATPLEKIDPETDWSHCQRFYWVRPNDYIILGYSVTGLSVYGMHNFPVTMRAQPTITFGSLNYTNCSGLNILGNTIAGFSINAIVTSTSVAYVSGVIMTSADL